MTQRSQNLILFGIILSLVVSLISLICSLHIYNIIIKGQESPPKFPEEPLYRADYCVVPDYDAGIFDFYIKLYSIELDDWDTELSIYSFINNRSKDFTTPVVFSEGCAIAKIENIPFEINSDIFVSFTYERGPLSEGIDLFGINIQDNFLWDVPFAMDGLELNYTGYGFILDDF